MADPSYIFFNKSLLQCRRLGARGGRAYGRNQRARRALMPAAPEALPMRAVLQETTAKAIAVLEAQFPWLCRAELHAPLAGMDSDARQPQRTCRRARNGSRDFL